MVGEDVLETDVGLGHAQVRVLGVEDFDEFGGCVAHFWMMGTREDRLT